WALVYEHSQLSIKLVKYSYNEWRLLMDDLTRIADLIREKNVVDNKIADIIGRPAQVGHAGEYIEATIFGVTLHHSASQKSSDGYFINEPLVGLLFEN